MTGLDGAVVMVTGALGGLGSAIVDGFADAGATVVVHHVRQGADAAERVAALQRAGVTAVAAEFDLTDERETERAFEDVMKQTGRLDVLVNNAGYLSSSPFAETSLPEWQRTIDIDLTGTFIASRAAVRVMQRQGSGAIVNVASQLAYRGARDHAAYSAAKGGVVGLTHAMARELGPEIRVNAVAPGPIETALIADIATDEYREVRSRDLVAQRFGTANEVAPAVVFLASTGASYIHGQVVHVNGGGVMS
ncbi:SDR family NAD(P)-dependent oxidoreductase [Pseudactinotalea sp.]|uniref:SDR family NAD(P)-dependent oxidoreductase n=1 Tax=Pseudactinotalea sp. TaxID=1926260 RepID=UPI003B3B7721